jgi:hypothetical protein
LKIFLNPYNDTLSEVGLKALTPQNAAGTLMLPPISVPIDNGAHLDAISPASPPDEPPVDLVLSNGFYAHPQILFSE